MAVAGTLAGQPTGDAHRLSQTGDTTGARPQSTEATPATDETAAEAEPSQAPAPEPAPRSYRGVSAKVLKLRKSDWTNVWLVSFTHRGTSNFIVEPLDPRGAAQSAIVNEIGTYKGTVLLNEEDGSETAALKIQADGSWTVTLEPLSMTRVWSGAAVDGRSDDVVRLDPRSSGLTTVNARHSGSSNFIVDAYTENGEENLVNEIGSWHGEVPLPDGTILVTIKADGVWSLKKS
ncbi:hypothetical protein [Microbispora sp. NPDC049125]|uniref:hypothetical protein n=1 Tax=Microbispora sp. NPDC049125 TaxID=3154929 RepID=UPI0034650E41